MLTFFFDFHGYLLIKFLPRGATANAECYQTTLTNLIAKFRQNKHGTLTSGIILLHDNARLHMVNTMKQKLAENGSEVLQQLPYGLDLSPCNFRIYYPLTKDLRGKKFNSYNAVHEGVLSWLQ